RGFRFRKRIARAEVIGVAHARVRRGEARIRVRVGRIRVQSELEVSRRFAPRGFAECISSPDERVERTRINRALIFEARPRLRRQLQMNLAGDGTGDLTLHRGDVFEVSIESLAPEMLI